MAKRKALIVGIDYYEHVDSLFGCVRDAHKVASILERHSNGQKNFDTKALIATSARDAITRSELKDSITELFATDAEVSLLYFAGHGHVETAGGYLCTSDSKRGDEGVALSEILTYANKSKAQNRIIVLDSCHSGVAGSHSTNSGTAELSDGLTILTASTEEQYASEENGAGVFTELFVDALGGAAANLLGAITPGSVYAHIDQSLGEWAQRPVFKTNVKTFVSLRQVDPPISLADLQQITTLFPTADFEFELDPSYEPELKGRDPDMPEPDLANVTKFDVLRKYNRVNLVVPVGAAHMWNAAMKSKACRLTVLGEHYRRLVEKKAI
jgi:hypothetical protein